MGEIEIPAMPNYLAFFSYAHNNDEADGGRVVQLGRDIATEYGAISGEEVLQIFIDKDSLHLGDDWLDEIDEGLQNVKFFIPILTPWFFKSIQCRRELQRFIDKVQKLGMDPMIFPILYIDVPELHEIDPRDPLMTRLKRIQWEPWGERRHTERTSQVYRTGVTKIAEELLRRSSILERTDITGAANTYEEQVTRKVHLVESVETEITVGLSGDAIVRHAPNVEREILSSENDDAPTELELLVAMEEALPRLTDILNEMAREMAEYADAISLGTSEIEAANIQGHGFAARLRIAFRLSKEIEGPIDRMEILGRRFASDLYEVDLGFRILLPRLVQEVSEDISNLSQVRGYLRNVKELADASLSSAGSTFNLVESIRPLEKISKDLRAPIRKLRDTLTAMSEAQGITDNWIAMMNDSGIDYLDEA